MAKNRVIGKKGHRSVKRVANLAKKAAPLTEEEESLRKQYGAVIEAKNLNAEQIRRLINAGLSTLALGYYMRLWAGSDKNNILVFWDGTPDNLERAFGLTHDQRLDCDRELAAHGLAQVTYSEPSEI